ncbi:hypothetical protein JB92DRAFT_3046333 [Gautieria morchelliformis]|nr:hypothetical protein JB92DRAFT_3046333 [Gautieria morchelliformis]
MSCRIHCPNGTGMSAVQSPYAAHRRRRYLMARGAGLERKVLDMTALPGIPPSPNWQHLLPVGWPWWSTPPPGCNINLMRQGYVSVCRTHAKPRTCSAHHLYGLSFRYHRRRTFRDMVVHHCHCMAHFPAVGKGL